RVAAWADDSQPWWRWPEATGETAEVRRPTRQQGWWFCRLGPARRQPAEGVVVVLVLVAGQDAADAGPDHLQESMIREVGIAGVGQGVGEGPGEPDAVVELADGEQAGIAGELARRALDHEWRAEEVEDLGPGGW